MKRFINKSQDKWSRNKNMLESRYLFTFLPVGAMFSFLTTLPPPRVLMIVLLALLAAEEAFLLPATVEDPVPTVVDDELGTILAVITGRALAFLLLSWFDLEHG